MAQKIQVRRDTEAAWAAANPVLSDGEFAFSRAPVGKMKIGNGTSTWSTLSYVGGLSAYEVAVSNGFVGTESQWLASLEGDPGTPIVLYNESTNVWPARPTSSTPVIWQGPYTAGEPPGAVVGDAVNLDTGLFTIALDQGAPLPANTPRPCLVYRIAP